MVYVHLHWTFLAFHLYFLIDCNNKVVTINALQYAFDFLSVLTEHLNFLTNEVLILLRNL